MRAPSKRLQTVTAYRLRPLDRRQLRRYIRVNRLDVDVFEMTSNNELRRRIVRALARRAEIEDFEQMWSDLFDGAEEAAA